MSTPPHLSQLNCALARALSLIGDGWSILIVRDALLGVRRFSQFQASLGIARNILAARLRDLTEAGVLARSGTDTRPLYTLTDKGLALAPALLALAQWGTDWEFAGQAPMVFCDAAGAPLAPVSLRTVRGKAVDPADIRASPGPAADKRTRMFLALLEQGRTENSDG